MIISKLSCHSGAVGKAGEDPSSAAYARPPSLKGAQELPWQVKGTRAALHSQPGLKCPGCLHQMWDGGSKRFLAGKATLSLGAEVASLSQTFSVMKCTHSGWGLSTAAMARPPHPAGARTEQRVSLWVSA